VFSAVAGSSWRFVFWSVELSQLLVDPSPAIVSSPDAASKELSGYGAVRDIHAPNVPELPTGRLSGMPVIEWRSGHCMLFRIVGEAATCGGDL
jgi:hypothetical protein